MTLREKLKEEAVKHLKESGVLERINAVEANAHIHGTPEYTGKDLPTLLEEMTDHTISTTLDEVEREVAERMMKDDTGDKADPFFSEPRAYNSALTQVLSILNDMRK